MSLVLIPIWAPEANYPAGPNPWNGNPTKVVPVGDYFIPGTKPPAQWINYEFNAVTTAVQGTQYFALAAGATNWDDAIQQGIIGTMGADFGSGQFDPSTNQWIVTTLHEAAFSYDLWVSQGLDGSAAAGWQQIGTNNVIPGSPTLNAIDCAPDAQVTGKYNVAITFAGSTQFSVYQSSSWVQLRFRTLSGPTYRGCAITAFNNYIIYAVAVSDGSAAFSSSNNNGSSWTDFSTGTPSMPAGSNWLLKSNRLPQGVASGSDMVLAVPGLAKLGTATSVWKTVDGVTWTASASLGGLLSPGSSVVGLAWSLDAAGPCWIATAQTSLKLSGTVNVANGSAAITFSAGQTLPAGQAIVFAQQPGTVYFLASAMTGGTAGTLTSVYSGTTNAATTTVPSTAVFRSVDGATWTIQRAMGPAFALSDLAANGSLLVAVTSDASSGGSSISIFSIDGGVTWYPTQATLFANEATSFAGYTRPRIVSSGVQFFAWNNLWMRFSALAGLPVVSY